MLTSTVCGSTGRLGGALGRAGTGAEFERDSRPIAAAATSTITATAAAMGQGKWCRTSGRGSFGPTATAGARSTGAGGAGPLPTACS